MPKVILTKMFISFLRKRLKPQLYESLVLVVFVIAIVATVEKSSVILKLQIISLTKRSEK